MIFKSEKKLIKEIEEKTGLIFLENESDENLCYAQNNSDMRDEFKSVFTLSDLKYFIKSFLQDSINIPSDSTTFWKLVEKGKGLAMK